MGQSVDLRVLTAEEFGPFRQRNIARYAQELLFARATDTEEHALTEAQGALDEMLPQGAETPRNYLLAAESGGETVGELWCDTTEPETVFINDFFVYPACRGHGWGNAMLRAVEELAAAQSFEQVVTHVYHTNRIALAMLVSMACAVVTYLVAVVKTHAITLADLQLIPKGEKLAKVLHIR